MKFGIALILMAAACVSLWLFYFPEHWFWRVTNFANVTVDDRPVQADVYIGHPTYNEAEAFLLLNIQGVGTFLFNFEEETFRKVSSQDFVRLYWGALTVKPMSNGPWVQPLPFRNLNEFRVVSSNGHNVTVGF
jgi:hypothetical protein